MKWKTKINHPLVLRIEGQLLLIEGLFMLMVLPVTYLYHGLYAFSMPFSALITLLTGFILLIATRDHKDDKITSRDGVFVVCISWLVLSLFGAIPFLLSKSVPNFTDGFLRHCRASPPREPPFSPASKTFQKTSFSGAA